MSRANPLWGAPRIHGELVKVGINVCQATVAKYMVRHNTPPSQTWRTFLTNHIGQTVAICPRSTGGGRDRRGARLLIALVGVR